MGIGKRGVVLREMLLFIVELVLIGMVFFSLINLVKTVEQGTLLEKTFLSKDMALLLNTIYAAPNSVQTSYLFDSIDLTKFIIEIDDGRVKVQDNIEGGGNPRFYSFGTDKNIRIDNEEYSASRFEVINNGIQVRIGENIALEDSGFYCSKRRGGIEFNRIVIDPGHGGDDQGYGSNYYSESFNNLVFAKALDNEIRNEFNVLATRSRNDGGLYSYGEDLGVDRFELIKDGFFGSDDFIVSLHMGDYNIENNFLRIFIASGGNREIRSFGCHILQELQNIKDGNDYVFDDVAIFEVDSSKLKRSSHYVILSHQPSIVIEYGNIKNENVDPVVLGNAIKRQLMVFREVPNG